MMADLPLIVYPKTEKMDKSSKTSRKKTRFSKAYMVEFEEWNANNEKPKPIDLRRYKITNRHLGE